MEQVALSAIGVLAAFSTASIVLMITLMRKFDARLDAVNSRIDAVGDRIDALGARLDARLDALAAQLQAHIERHAS